MRMRTAPTTLVLVVVVDATVPPPPEPADWLLLDPGMFPATLATTSTGLRLSNGLVTRDFVLQPNFGTVDLFSHEAGGDIVPSQPSQHIEHTRACPRPPRGGQYPPLTRRTALCCGRCPPRRSCGW